MIFRNVINIGLCVGWLVLLLASATCRKQIEPGEFTIVFEWVDPPAADAVLYAWARVEQRDPRSPLRPGVIVAEATVTRWRDSRSLSR